MFIAMAASRKLQGEIERCLKKVTEGVDTFEDIWQKVHNAANSNQKEKYEADLKKEIKKLQRLRDQIKTWIASAEIKDKSNLLDYRKLIETQMERFKVVERETKTKAYSKEGLGAIQKLDPAQKQREETSCWLIQCIDAINIQVDKFESEAEVLSVAVGKKKRADKDRQNRVDWLKMKVEKHRYHIKKLETLLRMLDNMSIEPDEIKKIKEDVEYYIESALDMDVVDNDFLYDDIVGLNRPPPEDDEEDLENLDGTEVVPHTGETPPSTTPVQNHSGEDSSTISAEDSNKPSDQILQYTPVLSSAPLTDAMIKPSESQCNNNSGNNCHSSSSSSSSSSSCSSASSGTKLSTIPATSNNSSSSISSGNNNGNMYKSNPGNIGGNPNKIPAVSSSVIHVFPSATSVQSSTHTGNFATIAAAIPHNSSYSNKSSIASVVASAHIPTENGMLPNQQVNIKDTSGLMTTAHFSHSHHSVMSTVPPTAHSLPNTPSSSICEQHNSIGGRSSPPSSISSLTSPVPTPPPSQMQLDHSNQHPSLKTIAQETIDKHNLGALYMDNSEDMFDRKQDLFNSPVHNSSGGFSMCPTFNMTNNSNSNNNTAKLVSEPLAKEITEAHIPPLLGVAPLGPLPLQKEHQDQYIMLEAAFTRIPHPSDIEKQRHYLPRVPCNMPEHYKEVPMILADNLEYYSQLSPETLFFIFYYMEGTKAQYLSAQALKKQSWRFHTKYMMWFQRHEEPKTINEEFEQGTYVYFDFEKWSHRKKEGFTFEYKYLEDRELN